MLSLRAGRGELQVGEGGWSEAVGAEARRWGAGEDFFAIIEGSGDVSVSRISKRLLVDVERAGLEKKQGKEAHARHISLSQMV